MAEPPKVYVAPWSKTKQAQPKLVTPSASQSEPDKIQTADEAKWAMTAAGYINVRNIVREGRIWRADANNASGSDPVVLVCSADDGRITLEPVAKGRDKPAVS